MSAGDCPKGGKHELSFFKMDGKKIVFICDKCGETFTSGY